MQWKCGFIKVLSPQPLKQQDFPAKPINYKAITEISGFTCDGKVNPLKSFMSRFNFDDA